MFENYMLLNRGFQNVRQGNEIIGFQILVKIAYYRGVFLPLIGDFEVTVDGEKFGVEQMKITVGRHTYTFDQTANAETVRWEFGKPLALTIRKPGGLKPGLHEIFFLQNIKPSYTGERGRISSVTKKMTLVV
jgi:hypothetical protein